MARRTNTRCVRFSIVSKVFIPDVSFKVPILTSVGKTAARALSIRLVIARPVHCIRRFIGTKTSVIAIRCRTYRSLRTAVSGVRTTKTGIKVSVGPGAPIRILLPCLSRTRVFLVVSMRPKFNKRTFVPRSLRHVDRLEGLLGRGKLAASVRMSNKVCRGGITRMLTTKTGMVISNSKIFGNSVGSGATGFVRVLGNGIWRGDCYR